MANEKFKAAVKKAKSLYKTGRYKKFSDAVRAAHNMQARTPAKKKATRKVRRKATRRPAVKRKTTVRAARRKKPVVSKKSAVKKKLANALLDYELATTISATKAAQKRKVKYRKELRKL